MKNRRHAPKTRPDRAGRSGRGILPGGPDDAEAALRNLLTSLRPVYSKWKEADTPEPPPAPPAVGAAPWVRAATDLRDATPADVALAALGGAARRPERRPERRRTNAPKRPPPAAAQPRGCARRRPGAAEAAARGGAATARSVSGSAAAGLRGGGRRLDRGTRQGRLLRARRRGPRGAPTT